MPAIFAFLIVICFSQAGKVEAASSPLPEGSGAGQDAEKQGRVLQTTGDKQAIMKAVESWRAAWSAGEQDHFFQAYDASFAPEHYPILSAWKRHKKHLFATRKNIRIKISGIRVAMESGRRARVQFYQQYSSDEYNSIDSKELQFVNKGNGWKIVSERVIDPKQMRTQVDEKRKDTPATKTSVLESGVVDTARAATAVSPSIAAPVPSRKKAARNRVTDEVAAISSAGKVAAPAIIVAVKIIGNRHIERGTVMASIYSKKGDTLNPETVSGDLRRLFTTGFFSDIKVLRNRSSGNGIDLVFEVKENPLVRNIAIKGNSEIEDKVLKPKLKLKSGYVFNQERVRTDIQTLRRLYFKKGYYQIQVKADTKVLKDGRVDVVLRIREGEITRVKRIRFVGNRAFTDSKLRGVLASREATSLVSWITDRDVVKKDQLAADSKLLEQYYRNHGFLDVRTESALFTLSPDKRWFYMTFNLHEGPEYRVSKIDLKGDIVPSKEELLDTIELVIGETYSEEKLRNSIMLMTEKVGDEGFAFSSVTPLFHRHVDERTVDITFDIEKGRKVFIERVEISGNNKSEDRVIRREIRVDEGERFSASKLNLSKKRLKRLDYFDDVRVSLPRGSAPDKVRMKVELEEKRTGSFSFGAGFSQLEKVFVTAKLNQKNFLGKGLNTSLSGQIGVKTQNYNLSVTDPYFLDKELSVTLSTFKQQTRLQEIVQYKQDSLGVSVNFNLPITEDFSYGFGYSISRTNIFDIPFDASLLFRSQEGKQTIGEISQSLNWFTTDHPVTPTSGHVENLHLGIAGLGGDNRFVEVVASSKVYFSLGSDFILSPSVQGRYIRGFSGRAVPLYRLYSLGGIGTLRGFDDFGVTILDPATGDIIGGNKTATASLDLFFPLPYVQTSGFRGLIFADVGTVGDFNQTMKFSDFRASYGFGIQWLSPVGPIGLVWGFPFRKKAQDRIRNFNFAIGNQF